MPNRPTQYVTPEELEALVPDGATITLHARHAEFTSDRFRYVARLPEVAR